MPPLKDIDFDELDNLDPDDFEDELDTPEARGDVVDPNEEGEEDEEETKNEADEEESDEEESDEEEPDEEEPDEEEPDEEDAAKDTRWIPKNRFDEINDRRKQAEQRLAELERKAEESGQGGKDFDRIGQIQQELTALDEEINTAMLEADSDKLAKLRAKERQLNKEAMDFQLQNVTTQAVSEARYDAFLDKVEADFPEYDPNHESYNDELVTETLELQQAFMTKGQSKTDALVRAIRYVRPQYIREEPAEKPSLRGKPPARDTSTKKARNQKVAKAQPKSPPSRTSKLDSAEDIDVNNFNDPEDLEKLSAKELARLSGDYV